MQQTIDPNGGFRFWVRDFGVPASLQTGSIVVTSTTGLPITGYIAYAETVAAGIAVAPALQEPQTALVFSHIADLTPWLTGLALFNPDSARTANVQVFAIAPDGASIGSFNFSLSSRAKTSRLLSQMVPQTQTRTSDGGYVFVKSDVPLVGIELFFSRNMKIVSNVPAGRLLPGIPPPR
jgi:hypothetical protein